MIRFAFPVLALGAALAACTSVPVDDRDAGGSGDGGTCNAQPAQRFIGATANSETGGAILAATGARTLRWGPPGAIFTMDFRQDRVNVMHDAQLRITEIRCG